MRVAGKVLLWAAGIYIVAVLGSGLLIKALLTAGRIDAVVMTLTAGLPVQVSAGEGSFDLLPWIRFEPVIRIQRISVSNPPGYSAEPMLTVGEAGAQVSVSSLFGQTVQVRRVELRDAALNVETDAKGISNLADLLAALDRRKEPVQPKTEETARGKAVAIDRVSLIGGTVRYKERGSAAGLTVRDIHLSISGFGGGGPAKLNLEAGLFGSKASKLVFRGQAGPYSQESLPAEGSFSVVVAPAEIPKAVRQEYAGDLLSDPPAGATAKLEASLKGDLMKSLDGAGELELREFAVGRSEASRVPLNGKAPFRVSLRRPLSMPAVEISTGAATMQLGRGRWKGSLAAQYSRQGIRGESRGTISGVRVEELTRVFTTAKDPVFGRAEIPEYELFFAGKNAAELRQSLRGSGSIRLEEGRVAVFDLLGTIESKVERILSGDTGKPGETDFLKMAAKFEIKDGQILFTELALQNLSSTVSGQGFATFDHALSFDLVADMTGGLASRFGGKPDSEGVARLRVPVRVRGTLDSPKVYPDIGGMAKSAAVEKARGLLDSFLKKRQGETDRPK